MKAWIKIIKTVEKAGDVHDKAEEEVAPVKTLAEQLLKKKPADLTLKDFNALADEDMGKVEAEIDKTVAVLDKILAVKWTAPDVPDEIGDLYATMLQVAADKGKDSKELKKAAATWGKVCSAFRDEMLEASVPIRVAKAEVPRKIQSAQAAHRIVASLEPILEKCAKIPMPGSTAQNAQFFSLFEQCGRVMAGCNKIESRLIAIQDTNHDAFTELSDMMKENDKRIAFASKASGLSKEELAKNKKTMVP